MTFVESYRARPTVHRGVRMRSRLEAAVAAAFDDGGVEWQYEPAAFQAVGGGQYLPDFCVLLPVLTDAFAPSWGPRLVYIEVKPTIEAANEASRDKRMEAIWSSEPDALLVVTVPTIAAAIVVAPGHKSRLLRWASCPRCGTDLHLTGILWRPLCESCDALPHQHRSLVPLEYWKQ